jgi:hypothetical protein
MVTIPAEYLAKDGVIPAFRVARVDQPGG